MTAAGAPAEVPVSRRRAGRDIAAQMVLRALNLALGVAVTLVLVRALGDVGFGQWSTLFAVVMFVGYFGDMGLDRVAVERAAAAPEQAPAWVGALVTLRLLLSIPTMLVAMGVCLWVADGAAMRTAAVIVGALVPISALSAVRVVFQLQVRNAITTLIEVGNGVLWAGAVLLVATQDGGLVPVAAAFLLVTTVTAIVQVALAVRAAPVRWRGARRLWRPLFALGVPVGVGGLLTLGYGYIDQVIVFELAGARDAGLYGAVYRIYERIQFLPGAMMTTLFPIFVAARAADPARVKRLFGLAIDYLVLLSLPALTIALAGPEPIVRLLFGAEFADAAPALPILMATFVLVSVGYLAGYLIIAYGLQRRFVIVAVVALALNVTANLLTVPRWGFLAAAWVTLATELFVVCCTLTMICRRIGVSPRGRHLGRIAGAAAAAGLGAWGLRLAGVPVGVWAPVGAGAYALMLLGLRVVHIGELRALIGREPG